MHLRSLPYGPMPIRSEITLTCRDLEITAEIVSAAKVVSALTVVVAVGVGVVLGLLSSVTYISWQASHVRSNWEPDLRRSSCCRASYHPTLLVSTVLALFPLASPLLAPRLRLLARIIELSSE